MVCLFKCNIYKDLNEAELYTEQRTTLVLTILVIHVLLFDSIHTFKGLGRQAPG